MPPPAYPLLQLLYDALNAKYGIVVSTSDFEHLRQKLYEARRTDEIFAPLSLLQSPFNPNDLWIIKRSQPDEG